MRFTKYSLALPALVALSSVPVAAQDVVFAAGTGEPTEALDYEQEALPASDRADEMASMANRMSDPVVQHGVAAVVEHMSGSVMRMPVGGFVDAIERARPGTVSRRLPRNATVGDLAGRDADYLPQRLGDGSREVMGMMGGFAQAVATMMPEFERMSREMEESFRAAKAQARRSGY